MRREAALLPLACVLIWAPARADRLGLGRTPTPAELRAFDIDVRGDGAGLPPGHGSVAQGRALYASKCAACHGAEGGGGAGPALAGGIGKMPDLKLLEVQWNEVDDEDEHLQTLSTQLKQRGGKVVINDEDEEEEEEAKEPEPDADPLDELTSKMGKVEIQ